MVALLSIPWWNSFLENSVLYFLKGSEPSGSPALLPALLPPHLSVYPFPVWVSPFLSGSLHKAFQLLSWPCKPPCLSSRPSDSQIPWQESRIRECPHPVLGDLNGKECAVWEQVVTWFPLQDLVEVLSKQIFGGYLSPAFLKQQQQQAGGEEKAAQLPVRREFPPQKLKTPNLGQPSMTATLNPRGEVPNYQQKYCVGQEQAVTPLQQLSLFRSDNGILNRVSAPVSVDPRTTGNLHDPWGNHPDSSHRLAPLFPHLQVYRKKRGFPSPSLSNGALTISTESATKSRTARKCVSSFPTLTSTV